MHFGGATDNVIRGVQWLLTRLAMTGTLGLDEVIFNENRIQRPDFASNKDIRIHTEDEHGSASRDGQLEGQGEEEGKAANTTLNYERDSYHSQV